MTKRYTFKLVVAYLLFALVGIGSLTAQKVDKLEQVANGRLGQPLPAEVDWTSGNVNESKSHYAECMSIPYHLEMINLAPSTTYCVVIGYDTKRSDRHAIDFLTSWDADICDNHEDLFGHVHDPSMSPELIDPLSGTTLDGTGATEARFDLPTPTFPGAVVFDIDPDVYYDDKVVMSDMNEISIWNGTIVGTPCIAGEEDVSMGTAAAGVEVCFQTTNEINTNSVVLAWGGHIASRVTWGDGFSAGNISGSSYHMFVAACNGDTYLNSVNAGCAAPTVPAGMLDGCGNKEVQLSANAVIAENADCTILGADPICGDATQTYGVLFDQELGDILEIDWTISDETGVSDATFGNNTKATTVMAVPFEVDVTASGGGSFLLTAEITYRIAGSNGNGPNTRATVTCTKTVMVQENPTVTLTAAPNTPVCADDEPITLTASPVPDEDNLGTLFLADGSDPDNGALTLSEPFDGTASFDPEVSGPGTFTYAYEYTTAAGCSGMDMVTIVVNALPDVSIEDPGIICENGGPVSFSGLVGGMDATSGTFSVDGNTPLPNGTTLTQFEGEATITPGEGSAGEYKIIFNYTDAENCSNMAMIMVTIAAPPELTLEFVPEMVCETGDPVAITATPPGGTFTSNPGVGMALDQSNDDGTATFDPMAAGSDNSPYTIRYTYTDPQTGCTNFIEKDLVVNPEPTVMLERQGDICPLEGTGATQLIFTATTSDGGIGTFTIDPDMIDGDFSQTGNVFTLNLAATDDGVYEISFNYSSAAGCPAEEVSVTIDRTECCEFFATCILEGDEKELEFCSYTDFLVANPLPGTIIIDENTSDDDLAIVNRVFSSLTTQPCGTLGVAASDVVSGSLCPDGILVTRTWIIFDDTSAPFGEFNVGEESVSCFERFRLIDEEAPEITDCPDGDDQLACDDTSVTIENGTITVAMFESRGGAFTDNCRDDFVDDAGYTVNVSTEVIGADDLCDGKTIIKTYTITDPCGNTSEGCTQTFTFLPPAAPSLAQINFIPEITCEQLATFEAPNLPYSNNLLGDCNISGSVEPDVNMEAVTKCGGTIVVEYSAFIECTQTSLSAGPFEITVLPPDEPTLGTDPELGPYTCAEAAAATTATGGLIPYSNDAENMACLIAGSIPAVEVIPNFDECGGTITFNYRGVAECGTVLSTSVTADVLPASGPEFDFQPGNITVDCIDDITTNSLAYDNDEDGVCEISGSVTSTIVPDPDQIDLICDGVFTETWTYEYCGSDEGPKVITTSRMVTLSRDIAVVAEDVEICFDMDVVELIYEITENSPAGDVEYMIDADPDAEAAGFVDVDWTPLPDGPLEYAFPEGLTEEQAYNFNFKVRSADCSSCVADDPFTITPGLMGEEFICITEVTVTLDDDCEFEILPVNVLRGTLSCAGLLDFEINIEDSYPENGNIIDGCGRYIYTIAPIRDFEGCWGYVTAEDKTSPRILELPEAPDTLLCNEVDLVDINDAVAVNARCYEVDSDGDFLRYGSITKLEDFLEDTELGRRLVAGGGLPDVYDGCSDMTVCVTDELGYGSRYEEGYGEDICDGIYLERSFTVTDGDCPSISGEENDPTIDSYRIYFYRPNLYDLVDEYTWHYEYGEAKFSCADYSDTDGNPVPSPEDYPYFVGDSYEAYHVFSYRNERVYVNDAFCNLGATYEDGPRVSTCDNTYKFIRTYTVFDWCKPGYTRTYTQVVKVGDFSGPELTLPTQDRDFDGVPDEGALIYSTNSLDCSAYFVIPAGSAVDSCDANPTVTAVVYPFGDEGALPIGPFAVGDLAGPFPVTGEGEAHVLVYTAEDACGNKTSDEIEFRILDQTAPVAICEDGLNISIGGAGVAIISAEDINKASYDECGDITLTIACVDENNEAIADDGDAGDDPKDGPDVYYDATLPVDCDDLGVKRISLRVEDASGNVNYCWLDVLIEDKGAPICIPPAAQTLLCTDLAGDFPEDLNELFEADPAGTAALLDAQFGAANGVDNCGDVSVTQTVEDKRNSCGKGQIIRDFVVEDAQGLTSSGTCRQVITVDLVHDYTIVLPGDVGSEDCVEDDYMGVTFDERGCDLITIFTQIDTFTATAEECYKLRITYEILNWCEYNGETDPYVIPRDADDDNDLEEDTYLHIEANDEGDLDDDTAELDRDNDPSNNLTTGDKSFIAFLDIDDEPGLVQGSNVEAGYGIDGSRGAFLYRQFIKVYDENAPLLTVVEPDGPGLDNDGDCLGNIDLEFSVDDDCSPGSIGLTASLNPFVEDANDDGIITLAEFVPGSDVTDNITSLGNGTFEINLTDLPFGRHAVRISATDGCGNTAIKLIVFDIEDNKAPTPICINGLTATLMPDGEGGGMAAIWANDFIASPSTDCSGEVKFAIYRSDTAATPGFEPNVIDTGLLLDCADLGMLAVRIYAIDPAGQSDYCETTLFVQAFQETVCENAGGSPSLAGTILTAAATPVSSVEVNVTDGGNSMSVNGMTNANGDYAVTDLDAGLDYTVQPRFNPAVNLGRVSTGDLILISRHILAIQNFTSDFQNLAADVNQDGLVNVIDIIGIRRVILGLDNAFTQSASWRFYAADGAEVENINNLEVSVTGVDFTAVEMGNVSDAVANGYRTEAESRSRASLELLDRNYAAGEVFTVELTAADLAGFQGTMELETGLEVVDMTFAAGSDAAVNLNEAATGLIALSWVATQGADAKLPVGTLTLRASTDGRLSESISLNDRITYTEAYPQTGGVASLDLNFIDAEAGVFSLEQNTPNPFAEQTLIKFHVPATGQATLVVQDVQGRVVLERQVEAVKGTNSIQLLRSDLKGFSGVLNYTISTGTDVATRRMIVVR